jgi:hypothetical protein
MISLGYIRKKQFAYPGMVNLVSDAVDGLVKKGIS